MWLRLAGGALLALALSASPALACMGPTVILADNFSDPAWTLFLQGTPDVQGTLAIADNAAQMTPLPGDFTYADWENSYLDSADFCVDVLSPTVADPTQAAAGIVFGINDLFNFYVFAVQEDGQAAVLHWAKNNAIPGPGAWTDPLVPWRTAASLKTGGNVTNTLRVTWKGASGTADINGAEFATFTLPSFKNTTLGIWCEGDPGENPTTGATYQFTNDKITNVP